MSVWSDGVAWLRRKFGFSDDLPGRNEPIDEAGDIMLAGGADVDVLEGEMPIVEAPRPVTMMGMMGGMRR